jgi:hypothetical protein
MAKPVESYCLPQQEEERWGELVDWIHPSLSSLDYSQTETKVRVVTITVVVCAVLTILTHFL